MDDDLALSASIVAGTEITIDINKDKSGLGFSIIGGADTLLVSKFQALKRRIRHCFLRSWYTFTNLGVRMKNVKKHAASANFKPAQN